LTKTLYNMAQDAPDGAAAIWNRRLGIMQSAHAKRLRDSELISLDNDEHFTAWPSAGSLLLLRSIGHIFPMTDLRHVVTTPALLLIGQILGQTPIGSIEDIIKGIFCAALMLEYTKEAKRIGPEALAFLAGVINLFAVDIESSCSASPIPSFDSAPKIDEILDLRSNVINSFKDQKEDDINFKLSLEKDAMSSKSSPSAILITVLKMLRKSVENYAGDLQYSEPEVFDQIVRSLLRLAPKAKSSKFPDLITEEINETADSISKKLHNNDLRRPLLRRAAAKSSEIAIKSLAPRMEDPTKYAMGRDKNKTRTQAEKDQQRREYKREHKAVSRELRLDAAFVESERRKEKDRKDSKAREARNKNYSWMEQEQATMNQQVAQGGGLLKGGGTGAARIKAKSGKIGIKRGGKF
jgi:nucleolar protein 14